MMCRRWHRLWPLQRRRPPRPAAAMLQAGCRRPSAAAWIANSTAACYDVRMARAVSTPTTRMRPGTRPGVELHAADQNDWATKQQLRRDVWRVLPPLGRTAKEHQQTGRRRPWNGHSHPFSLVSSLLFWVRRGCCLVFGRGGGGGGGFVTDDMLRWASGCLLCETYDLHSLGFDDGNTCFSGAREPPLTGRAHTFIPCLCCSWVSPAASAAPFCGDMLALWSVLSLE